MSDLVLQCGHDVIFLLLDTPLIYGVAMFIFVGVTTIIFNLVKGGA